MDYFDFLRGMEDQPLLDHRSRGRRLLRQFPPPKKKYWNCSEAFIAKVQSLKYSTVLIVPI